MTEGKHNPFFKDRLFTALFGDEENKEATLELYNAINESSYADPDLIEFTTIDDALYISMKNDVSFIIGSEMNLWEHQSTMNPNMPVRGLMYFGQLYSQYMDKHGLNRFSSTRFALPVPKFVVFYNGSKEEPERSILKLSDSFEIKKEGDVEVKALMLNINHGHNKELMEKCKVLNDYAVLVSRVKQNKSSGLSPEEAVNEAIDYCIENNVLKSFLTQNRAGVFEMLLTEYNEMNAMRAFRAEGKAEGKAEGRAEGVEESLRNLAQTIMERKPELTHEEALAEARVWLRM